jgi:hypothetical protein
MTNTFEPFSILDHVQAREGRCRPRGRLWIAAEIKLDEELGKVDGAKGTAAALAGA